jgi:protein-S-isoprenylcysteine O-methyltransferase Ste14
MSLPTKVPIPRVLIQLLIVVVLVPLLPMLISGDWAWPEAWGYAAISSLGFVASRALAARRHPDLLAERARFMSAPDTKPWDRVLAPALAFASVFILAAAGLDRLYGWSAPLPAWVRLTALIVLLAGFVVGSWALIENRFFSGTVRIQSERGHTVVTTGPYRMVRHPGYAGALWSYVAMPLVFGSLWAFIPAALTLGVLVVRTALEDRTLQAELPGYADYARRTRYRLIPGVW